MGFQVSSIPVAKLRSTIATTPTQRGNYGIMAKYTFYRILGHIAISAAHLHCICEMNQNLIDHKDDPVAQHFSRIKYRLLTLWTVYAQTGYALYALLCDVLSLIRIDGILPRSVKEFRHTFFAAIVLPFTVSMSTYWFIYFTNRELVLPKAMGIILNDKINVDFHAIVYIYLVWEFLYLPKDKPARESSSFKIMLYTHITYMAIFLYTRYGDIGIWLYPLLYLLEGTIYLYGMFSIIIALTIGSYFAQWPLKEKLWRSRMEVQSKKN